jgi:hypothetical protein
VKQSSAEVKNTWNSRLHNPIYLNGMRKYFTAIFTGLCFPYFLAEITAHSVGVT